MHNRKSLPVSGLRRPNHGKTTSEGRTHGALYYALANGSKITRVLRELITPNGVGLSPDGNTVYYAETYPGRLWRLPLIGAGKRGKVEGFTPGVFVGAYPGLAYFDSLGVQADGGVCVATILAGGITKGRCTSPSRIDLPANRRRAKSQPSAIPNGSEAIVATLATRRLNRMAVHSWGEKYPIHALRQEGKALRLEDGCSLRRGQEAEKFLGIGIGP